MISGIIMASGFSKRMQQEKLLMKIDEVPMVEAVIRSAKESRLTEVILVYRNPEVKLLADRYEVKAIYNPNAHLGQSAAIKCGIEAAAVDTKAYLFMVGDQPFLQAEIIDKVIETYETNKPLIVVPTYKGKNTNPVLFDSSLRQSLLQIEGDQGGRGIIEAMRDRAEFIEMNDKAQLEDIDSIESYLQVIKKSPNNNH